LGNLASGGFRRTLLHEVSLIYLTALLRTAGSVHGSCNDPLDAMTVGQFLWQIMTASLSINLLAREVI
jgi:hypothetical protein